MVCHFPLIFQHVYEEGNERSEDRVGDKWERNFKRADNGDLLVKSYYVVNRRRI